MGYNKTTLFSYSSEPTKATPHHLLPSPSQPQSNNTPPPHSTSTPPSSSSDTRQQQQQQQPYLTTASSRQSTAQAATASRLPDSELEGYTDSASLTKVVDRRWYERNKHIYPASLWEEFDPEKDYAKESSRKDGLGNSYFFSR